MARWSAAEPTAGAGFLTPARRVAIPLFLSLFAAQAAIVALAPVLPSVASDFGVSTATAGQLRSVSGLAAGITALAMGALTRRLGLRDVLLAGLSALLAGSLLSAVAPGFATLLFAQVVIGAGLATVLAAGLAAAAEWSQLADRARVLSWTLIGQPVAWIVGMPLVGLVGDVSWRLAWIAVPFLGALVALAAVRGRPPEAPNDPAINSWRLLRHDANVAGWALGELLGFSAWAGTLVFAGALFVEAYSASSGETGLLLGLGAVAYLPGNMLARRFVDTESRRMLVALPVVAALLVAGFGCYRQSLILSVALFALLAAVAAGRTIAGSALGFEVCARRRVFAMRLRAAATQFGYLLGALLGGIALGFGGYTALGLTLAALFLLAAVPHAILLRRGGVAEVDGSELQPGDAQPEA
jgi:predicted MFS family arabinose efflux permease